MEGLTEGVHPGFLNLFQSKEGDALGVGPKPKKLTVLSATVAVIHVASCSLFQSEREQFQAGEVSFLGGFKDSLLYDREVNKGSIDLNHCIIEHPKFPLVYLPEVITQQLKRLKAF